MSPFPQIEAGKVMFLVAQETSLLLEDVERGWGWRYIYVYTMTYEFPWNLETKRSQMENHTS